VENLNFLTDRQSGSEVALSDLALPEGELHLRFHTSAGTEFALPATGIREVVSPAPDQITPIPNVSPLLLGTLNFRGRVLWVADLGQFLGESVLLNTDRAEISIIAVEDQDTLLGLAVEQIVGMGWLDVEAIQVSSTLPDGIAPFSQGQWLVEGRPPLCLLDPVSILRSARWAA
jgi:purine-binding chemotaxis protein CheW